jgi:hypothetical protein
VHHGLNTPVQSGFKTWLMKYRDRQREEIVSYRTLKDAHHSSVLGGAGRLLSSSFVHAFLHGFFQLLLVLGQKRVNLVVRFVADRVDLRSEVLA